MKQTTAEAMALARLYDVDLIDDPGDADLYLALARRTGGPILELAVGTGRLAEPLAAAGYDVTGVDIDAAMLERARSRVGGRADADRGHLDLVHADLLELDLPTAGTFRLGFIGLNSLFLLATRVRQGEALARLARHLAPGGVAVVDVWLPDADDLARFDGRLGLEYVRVDPETSRTVTKLVAARHDATFGVVDLVSIFDEGRPGEAQVRWVRHDALRLVGADELRAMAEAADLNVETLAGGYDLEPLGPGSDRAILIARRDGTPDEPA